MEYIGRENVRLERLASAIRHGIAEAMAEMKDPRIGFVTVTRVKVSSDMRNASVFVSVMGSGKEKESTLIALDHATGFFQKAVARKVKLRYIPRLKFFIDTGTDAFSRVQKLLKRLEEEERPAAEESMDDAED